MMYLLSKESFSVEKYLWYNKRKSRSSKIYVCAKQNQNNRTVLFNLDRNKRKEYDIHMGDIRDDG